MTKPLGRAEGRFARLPNAWIYDGGLVAFRTRSASRGTSCAALKILVALLLKAENKSAVSAGPAQGSISLTYEELEELTDLSRALISKGLKFLRAQGLISVAAEGTGRRKRYFITAYGPGDNYGRMSLTRLYGGASTLRIKTLYELSPRNEADVNALKLYLLFCAVYDRARRGALVSYKTIAEKTGVAEGKIRRALSVLYEHGLVRTERLERNDDGTNPPNLYRILGL